MHTQHTYIYLHTYTGITHILTHTYGHVHIYAYMHAHMDIYLHAHTQIYTYLHTINKHTHTYTHTLPYTRLVL